MSYAIANVIYGVPVTRKLITAMGREDNDDITSIGFESLYSASGDKAGYCGVKLGEFDETTELLKLSKVEAMRAKLTAKKEATVAKQIAALPAWVKKALPPVDIYVVFSSS